MDFKSYYEARKQLEDGVIDEAQFLSRLGQGMGAAAQHMLQGMKAGAGQFGNAMFGPQAKYDNAVRALDGLVGVIRKDQQLAQLRGANGGPIADELELVKSTLEKQRQAIPKMMAQHATNTFQQAGPAGKVGPAQNANPNPGMAPTATVPAAAAANPLMTRSYVA